ncbi:hypothetical protein GCM10009836_52250 [Pseudonocardia ailaonensis]|uniref:RNA polymerase sigma-70 region 2 domain-containing protein n=1 Tax=Pseudonocardia ailaonensis TaxID=367279 RepID=A0ABN2NF19_9PSEU
MTSREGPDLGDRHGRSSGRRVPQGARDPGTGRVRPRTGRGPADRVPRYFRPGEAGELDRLLRAAADGDVPAFGRLYDRTIALAYALARAATPDARTADLLVERIYQDVWSSAAGDGRSAGALDLLLAAVRRATAPPP